MSTSAVLPTTHDIHQPPAIVGEKGRGGERLGKGEGEREGRRRAGEGRGRAGEEKGERASVPVCWALTLSYIPLKSQKESR